MFTFWVYVIAAFGTLLFFFNMLSLFLALRRIGRLTPILEHIATEYSTKWFTLERLTEQKFKKRDCEDVITRLLLVKVLDSRDYESKEPNDFQEVLLTVAGNNVFLDADKLKPFLDMSEFRYIGPPPPRKKRKIRNSKWSILFPLGAKPAYA